MNEPKKTCGTCWYRTDGGWEPVCGLNPPRAIPIHRADGSATRYVPYQLTVGPDDSCPHHLECQSTETGPAAVVMNGGKPQQEEAAK